MFRIYNVLVRSNLYALIRQSNFVLGSFLNKSKCTVVWFSGFHIQTIQSDRGKWDRKKDVLRLEIVDKVMCVCFLFGRRHFFLLAFTSRAAGWFLFLNKYTCNYQTFSGMRSRVYFIYLYIVFIFLTLEEKQTRGKKTFVYFSECKWNKWLNFIKLDEIKSVRNETPRNTRVYK